MSNSCLKKNFCATLTEAQLTQRGNAAAIGEVKGGTARVKHTEYYAPDGRRVAASGQGRGVAIRKRTLTDGRVVVDKVMKSVSEKLK